MRLCKPPHKLGRPDVRALALGEDFRKYAVRISEVWIHVLTLREEGTPSMRVG